MKRNIFFGLLFICGLSVGFGSTQAYMVYPTFQHSYNTYRDSNCLVYGSCQRIASPDMYQQQRYQSAPQADNSISHSFNTTNNIQMDYDVQHDYHYNYTNTITNSYNTNAYNKHHTNHTTRQYHQTPKPTPHVSQPTCRADEVVVSAQRQCFSQAGSRCYMRRDGKRCTKRGVQIVPQPRLRPQPLYQCRSGETMVWSQAQCFDNYGSVCYQRPDAKRCTRKGVTPPSEKCQENPQKVCSTMRRAALRNKTMSQLGLAIPSQYQYIAQYRIQWFNGSWSPWYTPGNSDIDRKNNCTDGSQQANCARRVWSYFDDHTHEIKVCKIVYPSHNHCTQQHHYYQTSTPTKKPSHTHRAAPTQAQSPQGYSIQRYQGPLSTTRSSPAVMRRSENNSIFYGRDDDAHYYANQYTYGIARDVERTFR